MKDWMTDKYGYFFQQGCHINLNITGKKEIVIYFINGATPSGLVLAENIGMTNKLTKAQARATDGEIRGAYNLIADFGFNLDYTPEGFLLLIKRGDFETETYGISFTLEEFALLHEDSRRAILRKVKKDLHE